MRKWYVRRDALGVVESAHEEVRPGYAEELLDEAHADLDYLLRPPKITEEQRIIAWLAENKFVDALVRALNNPTSDLDHLPPNAALSNADLVAKIKANLAP